MDDKARGGVRRYLDTVKPEEFEPDIGEVNLTEMTLTGLADLYGSDKGTIKHKFTDIYAELIKDLCGSVPRIDVELDIVEFGVACGASLRMWANYMPSSRIVGLDIREDCSGLCSDLQNVKIFIADPATWNSDHSFDLIVDDASHIAEHIVAAIKNCWRWVKPGGFYVIEDMHCTYDPLYTKRFKKLFDSSVINDRSAILQLMDELMRVVDAHGDITYMRYVPQMLILRKRK